MSRPHPARRAQASFARQGQGCTYASAKKPAANGPNDRAPSTFKSTTRTSCRRRHPDRKKKKKKKTEEEDDVDDDDDDGSSYFFILFLTFVIIIMCSAGYIVSLQVSPTIPGIARLAGNLLINRLLWKFGISHGADDSFFCTLCSSCHYLIFYFFIDD